MFCWRRSRCRGASSHDVKTVLRLRRRTRSKHNAPSRLPTSTPRVLTVSLFACRRRMKSSHCCGPTRLIKQRRQVRFSFPCADGDSTGISCVVGSGCALTSQAKERYTTSDGRKWLVDDAVLKEVDNDLQMIMNCTQEGDVVSLDVTNVIKPSSLVTIPWRLTISSDSKDNCSSKDTATSKTRTRFTCPRENTGIFLVQ